MSDAFSVAPRDGGEVENWMDYSLRVEIGPHKPEGLIDSVASQIWNTKAGQMKV